MATAFLRALAATDPRPEIRGADVLASIFLDDEHRRPLQDPKSRAWVLQNRTAPGAYEFMIARTAFFDEMVRQGLQANIPQVVFLGAGYDSRPYRFRSLIRDTRIFELDTAPTQARKKDCLRAAGIAVPEQVFFVPVDFESGDFKPALFGAGFRPHDLSLFVWEGVTYYLSSVAVEHMLASVSSLSAAGSSIAFDYAAISDQSMGEPGARELRSHLQSRHPNEPIKFGIPAREISTFLREHGFGVLQHLSSAEMRERYLAGSRYPELHDPPSLLCLVEAQALQPWRRHLIS
jgi:methyltransferase (TIGR00027 family)